MGDHLSVISMYASLCPEHYKEDHVGERYAAVFRCSFSASGIKPNLKAIVVSILQLVLDY